MTFLQLPVALLDDALAATQYRFQIAHWLWQAELQNCGLAIVSDALKSHPAMARKATECRPGSGQCFCRILFWRLPMTFPNIDKRWSQMIQDNAMATANGEFELRIC